MTLSRLSVLLLVAACSSPSPAEDPAASPMAPFARFLPGEWHVTFLSGTTMTEQWEWGPGERSIRVKTGGQAANGDPWRGQRLYFWHEGERRLRALGFSPFARGISEGTVEFDGDVVETRSDLHQHDYGLRRMRTRWAFGAEDAYESSLFESDGLGNETLLVRLDYERSLEPARRPDDPQPPGPSRYLAPLEPLLGKTFETEGLARIPHQLPAQCDPSSSWCTSWCRTARRRGLCAPSSTVRHRRLANSCATADLGCAGSEAGEGFGLVTTAEYVPYADFVHLRTLADRELVCDAYLYHHTGANELRCIALTRTGGVAQGSVTELEGGSLVEFDLQLHEGGEAVPLIARLDFEGEDVLLRLWLYGEKEPSRTLRHRGAR